MRAIAAALLLAVAIPAAPEDLSEEVGEGLPAPNFALRTLNPEVVGTSWLALDRYVGEEPEDPSSRLVLLTFFASWCAPCQKEMPVLEQLHRMYRDRGLRVLAVDIDEDEQGIAAARRLLAANGVTYPVLSDRFNVLARRYLGEQAPLPSLFLVDRDGIVLRIERGYAKDASQFLIAEVQAGLGVRPPAVVAPAAPARGPREGAVRPVSAGGR
jgi:thiol-disulfide isomerase/thioredoxin